MAPLTRPRAGETIRILGAFVGLWFLSSCATRGPLHIYSATKSSLGNLTDTGPDGEARGPSFLAAGETLTGLAYDPFTDHLFLRLAPGNLIRVIDRPAGKLKREFIIAEASAMGGGDLAVRPRDGHLFLLDPDGAEIIETSRHGKFIRRWALAAGSGRAAGLAYDVRRDQLLVLSTGESATVTAYDRAGGTAGQASLGSGGNFSSLAYDSATEEFYAANFTTGSIDVFGRDGVFRRKILPPGNEIVPFVDVGERSFLRIF